MDESAIEREIEVVMSAVDDNPAMQPSEPQQTSVDFLSGIMAECSERASTIILEMEG